MLSKLLSISYFLIFHLFFELSAQSTLLRGPYLNNSSSEQIVVKWRTSESEIGKIIYGTDPNSLNMTLLESDSTTEHEILISNLNPSTKYYYQIGNSGQYYTPNDADYNFKTSPEIGTKGKYRFWVIGDFGNGSQNQVNVKNSFLNNFTDVHTDAWIWLGDNAYSSGTDQEYQDKVFEIYPEVLRNLVAWPCPGNHDYGSVDLSNNGPYYEIFTLPENGEAGGIPSGEEGYYSFDYGNVHFLSLNTEYLLWIINNNNQFIDWLEEDLQNTEADFIIAYFHQPAYSKGTHDSDDDFSRPQMMRQNVLPILEAYNVDLVLNGHSHSYERSYLINGHYGKSNTFNPSTMLIDGSNGNKDQGNAYIKYPTDSTVGTVYAVVGCSGQKGSGSSPLNHPVMYMSTEDYHGSMLIDVDSLEMTCRFVDTTGAELDAFSILKKDISTNIKERNYEHGIFMNAYPNPFHKNFTIAFELEQKEEIEISVFDVSGKLIDKVVSGEFTAGKHKVDYNPKKISANKIYFVEIRTQNNLFMKRLIRME